MYLTVWLEQNIVLKKKLLKLCGFDLNIWDLFVCLSVCLVDCLSVLMVRWLVWWWLSILYWLYCLLGLLLGWFDGWVKRNECWFDSLFFQLFFHVLFREKWFYIQCFLPVFFYNGELLFFSKNKTDFFFWTKANKKLLVVSLKSTQAIIVVFY